MRDDPMEAARWRKLDDQRRACMAWLFMLSLIAGLTGLVVLGLWFRCNP